MAQKGFDIDKKVFLRRFVALPLVFLLAFLPAVPVAHATDPVTAATLAITGGQLAGAGISGEAAISLAGPVGAVVGLTLAACGLNAYVTKASQEAGKTRTRFVCDNLAIWAFKAGYTEEQIYQKIVTGISVAADGTIQLGKEAAKTIQQFGNWLISEDGLVVENPSVSVPETYVNLADLNCPVMDTYTWYGSGSGRPYTFSVYPSSATLVVMAYSGTSNLGSLTFISDEPFTITQLSPYSNTYSSVQRGHYYGYTLDQNDNLDRPTAFTGLPVYNGTYWEFLSSLDGSYDVIGGTGQAEDVFTGTPQDWTANRDVLNPSADDIPIVLNPDLLNPILDALADGTQATMSITDYIEALQRAFDQALDDVKTGIAQLTDTVTGIQETIAIPDTATADPSITNPSVTPETTPIFDPSTVDPGTVITGFQFDLTEIFPFCLPFDVYKMLRLLDADPVAPSYRFQFNVPVPGLPGHSAGSWHFDYTIDLAQFNAVASLLRKLELLSFCIGLAYVTRSMFIRS